MNFRTRRNRRGRRCMGGGNSVAYNAARLDSMADAGSLYAASGGRKRSRRGGKRTRRAGSRKRRGGLSSQLIPWTLLAGYLSLGLSRRKSRKHNKKK